MQEQKNQVNLNINIKDIPDMQCYCGSIHFLGLHTLKYLSPLACGIQGGGTYAKNLYMCANPSCQQIYEAAMSEEQIKTLGAKVETERNVIDG